VTPMGGWASNSFYGIKSTGTIVSNGSLNAIDARDYLVTQGLLPGTWGPIE
jgi:hypothetical protein